MGMGMNPLKEKAQILILGTFHMREVEGLDTERRVKEIKEVVSKIKQFHPTKIAVEMEPKDSKRCNAQLKSYQDGSFTLPMNEIYQLGFRLAKELGHVRVYPTDWMGHSETSIGDIQHYAEQHQSEVWKEMLAEMGEVPALTAEQSILDYHKVLNQPQLLEAVHKVHVNMARIGTIDQYVGVDWLSWWYKRNLIMFSNLANLIESKDERILMIVGIGHSAILTHLIEESEVFDVVDPFVYLN